MSLKRVWIPSPNYSSRGGSGVRLVVVHTAEGATTYQSLGNFFANPSSQVSSHTGIDDTLGTVGEYVKRDGKAWTAANYNPQAVQTELCAFAEWSGSEWSNHQNMLKNTADWIREECNHYGLPITKLSASDAQGSGRGVCGHVDLGAGGGGHWDPGPNFPWSQVMDMARGGSGPSPQTQENEMIASATAANGTLHVFWAGDDKKTVWYRYQKSGSNDWIDGGTLTKAPNEIAGLSATLSDTGTLELFARYTNGDPAHLWQKKGETGWSGGTPGKQKAGFQALPK
jgi:hypothetical protein